MTPRKIYIVYDERAHFQPTDDCAVLVSCDSLEEARDYVRHDWPGSAIFSYDIEGKNLVNEQKVEVQP